ncbi:MAG: RNA polymerase sigma factor [Terriglobales bacterium]
MHRAAGKTSAARVVAICYDSPVCTMGQAQAAAPFDSLVAELYDRSGGARFGLSRADFAAALDRILAKHQPDAEIQKRSDFLRRLRVEELALALACAAGSEKAWEEFLTRYRERLFDAGRAIARDDVIGRELAESLYANLYASSSRDGQRVSKLTYYYGLGSLEGWLRTVLAQEYVDRYRSQRHTVSLEEQEEAGAQFAATEPAPQPAPDSRLDDATDAALASISAEERYILAAYFLDGRTLAEIGRTLGVHESTISRKLDRATAAVRKKIMQELLARGMDRRQAEEALETDVRDVRVDVRARLAQDRARPAFQGGKGQEQ